MQMATFIEGLREDLEAIAAVGDDAAAEAARRLSAALQGSAKIRLLETLSAAALEISRELPEGHVDVRVSGDDVEFVHVADEEAVATVSDDLSARITLRLPEGLKVRIEAAASLEGVSVNAWIVRVLARAATGGRGPRVGSRLTGFGRS